MNLKHDDDELNFTIHQRSLYRQTSQTAHRQSDIDHITPQRGAATLSDAERSSRQFRSGRGPGLFIEDKFLDTAINGHKIYLGAEWRPLLAQRPANSVS